MILNEPILDFFFFVFDRVYVEYMFVYFPQRKKDRKKDSF